MLKVKIEIPKTHQQSEMAMFRGIAQLCENFPMDIHRYRMKTNLQ